ncbi:hypothetical protein V501_05089 [Pseudogymnoascus sp. VKM F-4519 (FW-2642)]|nr:hypothetical protein V501_05089 [Pseudogymnoascus sp. VKM F-4519 (FW-2642)]
MARQSITIKQRRALRRWAHRQHPKPSQKACIQWFQETYGHKVSQSTISESLSITFARLDTEAGAGAIPASTLRIRSGFWPELEEVLWHWQLRIEARGAFTTGEILREKAREVWRQLPHYSNKPEPEFSTRWLEKFKKRHGIQARFQHGEAGSTPDVEEAMEKLRLITLQYKEEDIYNMVETGLFWRMRPSRGLLSQSMPGNRKEKARISVILCTNAIGEDRIQLWFIGKAKKPRALRGVDILGIGGVWKHNSKAWNTTIVMVEWLQAFYCHIGSSRKVLLTIDNFSAHIMGIELHPPPLNIQIEWLPPNSTSCTQPLDQGIIQNFKVYYRRQQLLLMLSHYEKDEDPYLIITIRHAIRWALRAWNTDIKNQTIRNCFLKSTLISTTKPILSLPISNDINALFQDVIQAGKIRDAMSLISFLNPIEEVEEKEDTTIE